MVVEKLASHFNSRFKKSHDVAGLVANASIDQQDFFLLLPLTYMNHSGLAVKQMAAQKKIELADISLHEIAAYQHFKLINAMVQFDSPAHPISNIILA